MSKYTLLNKNFVSLSLKNKLILTLPNYKRESSTISYFSPNTDKRNKISSLDFIINNKVSNTFPLGFYSSSTHFGATIEKNQFEKNQFEKNQFEKNQFVSALNKELNVSNNKTFFNFNRTNESLISLIQFLKTNFILQEKILKPNTSSSYIPYKKVIRGLNGKQLSYHSQHLFNSKSISYSFNPINNNNSLLASTKGIETILKKLFLSIGTIISRPVYLNSQNKLIIRLFVFLSPKLDLFLNTGLNNKNLWLELSKNQASYSFLPNKRPFISESEFALNKLKATVNKIDLKLNKRAKAIHFRLKMLISFLSQLNGNKNSITPLNKRLNYSNFNYISFFTLFHSYLENFSLLLGKLLNKKVEFEIIKLQFPYHDSNILSQLFGYNADKYNFRRMILKVLPLAHIKNPSEDIWYVKAKKDEKFESNKNEELFQPSSYLPPLFSVKGLNSRVLTKISCFKLIGSKGKYTSFLSGMNIRLGGRLITQSLRPKFTVQSIQRGSLARVKVDYVEKSRFTSKNKRGAYSFTVSISHVINK